MRRTRQHAEHDTHVERGLLRCIHAAPCRTLRRLTAHAGKLRRRLLLQRQQHQPRLRLLLFLVLLLALGCLTFLVTARCVMPRWPAGRSHALHSRTNNDTTTTPCTHCRPAHADNKGPLFRTETSESVTEQLYVERPDGHNGTVRVMFAMSKNNLDSTYCYAIASAFMTSIPLVVAGYAEPYHNSRKTDLALAAAEDAGLRDHDVVLVLDADLMFTGVDMLPYIDRFIAQSAASPRELDAKAVREGRAMAPSVYSTETNCYCPQQYFCAVSACRRVYATMREAVRQYNKRHNCTPFARLVDKEEEEAEGRYVNTGTSIHRVWSLRRLNASMELYRQANPPQCRRVWKDDQTVVHVLYIELRYWELAQNALLSHAAEEEEGRRGGGRGEGQCAASAHPASRAAAVLASSRTPRTARGNKGNITGTLANTTRTVTTTSSVYGLLAGQIGFDVRSELAAVVPDGLAEAYELTSELWHDEGPPQTLENVYDDGVIDFVDAVYRRNADRVNFTMRRFARNVAGTSLVMPFSPPMLVRRRRPASSSSSARVFPPIVHYAGPRKRRTRTALLAHLPWSLSLRHNATQLQALREYLLPMPLHVFGYHKRHNLRFATGCSGGRFWRVGDQLSVKRTYVMFRGRQYDTKDN